MEYTLAGMDLLLHRIGRSVQVPGRRAAGRDEARIAAWREVTWPVIKGRRRTWGRHGSTPVVTVTGGSNKRTSLAALIAIKTGCAPRLIYRVHNSRRRGKDKRKGFTEAGYARLLDAAHQQLARPLVVMWDNLNSW